MLFYLIQTFPKLFAWIFHHFDFMDSALNRRARRGKCLPCFRMSSRQANRYVIDSVTEKRLYTTLFTVSGRINFMISWSLWLCSAHTHTHITSTCNLVQYVSQETCCTDNQPIWPLFCCSTNLLFHVILPFFLRSWWLNSSMILFYLSI